MILLKTKCTKDCLSFYVKIEKFVINFNAWFLNAKKKD